VLTVVLIDPITRLVFGEKWLEALPIFYLLVLANLVVATSTPLQGLLNALGHSRITFAFTLLWAAVTWVLGLPLIWWLGALGFALANVGVQITNFWLFAIVKKQLPIQILRAALPSWALSFLVGAVIWLVDQLINISNLYILIILFAFGLALFGTLFLWKYKTEVRELYSAWKVE
jgi:O-antigen/teichoic acid export membrane protein